MATLRIQTQTYKNTHSRQPRGTGIWIFELSFQGGHSEQQLFGSTNYGRAKSQVLAYAKRIGGVRRIDVMP